MAIGAISYRNQLAAERNAGFSRIASGRGRVLTGFGGDLAGYNQSLVQKRADLEDQLVQKKYDNGEITLDELIAHLQKAANRSWVSPEERALAMENIESLEENKLDDVIANQYKNGQIDARQVASYTKAKLVKMTPGTPVYQNLEAEVAGWNQKANEEDLQLKEQQAITAASELGDSSESQLSLEKAYDELAETARGFGMEQEALAYTARANQAAQNATSYKEQSNTATAKVDRQNLIDELNMTINDYHDNKITGTDFLAKLDQLESTAINKGQSDLLDDMNKWVDATREDMAYGKAWDRGGTRTGGIKTGSGVTGTGTGGGSWDAQDKIYKDNVRQLQDELTSGKISADEYKSDLAAVLGVRAQDIQDRVDKLGDMDEDARVKYQGSNQKAGTILDKLDNELNNNWGAPLGLSESEAGKVGLVAMSEDFTNNQAGFVPVMNAVGSGPGTRPSISFQLLTPELTSNSVKDTSGIYHKVVSETVPKQVIGQDEYNNLPDNEKLNFNLDANGDWVEKTKPSKKYVDVYGQNGSQIRYYLDNKNQIIDWQDTVSDKQYLPEGKTSYKDYMDRPTNIDTPDYVLQRAKEQREAEMAALVNPPTQLPTLTPAQIKSDAMAEKMGVVKPSAIPNNLVIKPTTAQFGVENPKPIFGGNEDQSVIPRTSTVAQPAIRDVSQPSEINKNLRVAFPNQSLKLNNPTPAPTQQALDTQYQNVQSQTQQMFANDAKKQNSWLYNPVGKLKNLIGWK